MIVFEEPGDDYLLEDLKKNNPKTKVRTAALFIAFLLLIILIVKNGYSLKFVFARDLISETCKDDGHFNAKDDDEFRKEKIIQVLADNQKNLVAIKGVENVSIGEKKSGYRGRAIPVVQIKLNFVDAQQSKIPDTLCGFDVVKIYR